MQQDLFYLIDFVKFKALRLVSIPQYDLGSLRAEAASVGRQFNENVDYTFQSLVKPLMDQSITRPPRSPEVTMGDVLRIDRSVAGLAYANNSQNNAGHNDWFTLHVILIAC